MYPYVHTKALLIVSKAFLFEGGALLKPMKVRVFRPELYTSFSPKVPAGLFDEQGDETCRYVIFPAFCDVHVHFREPGFSYKETIETGTRAAAHGGYTAVCTMPNLNPVPDSLGHLEKERDLIKKEAHIRVYPYGSITKGEEGQKLSDMADMAPFVAGFSDDGRFVASDDVMRSALIEAKRCGKVIAAHCEDTVLTAGGYIHAGRYAKAHGHRGISAESEWRAIERDIALLKQTGGAYHVCHVSCAESVALIRRAKAAGLDITAETAPHYLVLCEEDLREEGRFKMNPPLRTRADVEALIEGLNDGIIDMIATDHAPHSREEKDKGLAESAFGVVGLETAFPILYTYLVKKRILSLDTLIECMAIRPRRRFSLPLENDWCLWDLEEVQTINSAEFFSKGKATPFEEQKVYGRCLCTVCRDTMVYESL